jgi:pimeloyl-ACP methyl ester carboxylesterase
MEMPQQATNLHTTVEGSDLPGIPTILIHGVGSESDRWEPVAKELRACGPVVRYDLRGHGRSMRPPGPYELADFVSDHVRLMEELGIERANVVGFSLGGLIAQAIALAHPQMVEKLVIISAIAGRTAEQKKAVLERLKTVEVKGPKEIAVDGASRWYTEEFRKKNPDVVKQHVERFASNDPAAYAAAFRVLATNDLVDQLSAIKASTLIITGSEDVGSPPEMAAAMHERIASSRLVVIDGVKHALLEEVPEKLTTEIKRFLSTWPEDLETSPGLAVRREVLGSKYVSRALANDDAISREFQRFVTDYCWGEIWTDGRLSRRERSLLVLGMTAALGRMGEFEAHTRGALRNGITPEELASVLKQITVYCGVPAGVGAAKCIRKVLEDGTD